MSLLFDTLRSQAEKNPEKPAINETASGNSLTYSALCQSIELAAKSIRKAGIAGMPVGLQLSNSAEWIILFYALLLCRSTPVLISPSSTTREVIECLNISGTNLLITDHRLSHQQIFDGYFFINPESLKNNGWVIPSESKKEFQADPGIVLFTFRGTGTTLGVLFREDALYQSILINQDATGVDENLILGWILPAHHIFALTTSLLVPLSIGGTVVVLQDTTSFAILNQFEKHRINFFTGIPLLIHLWNHSLRKKPVHLNPELKGVIGGYTPDTGLIDEWMSLTSAELIEGYGLTETCPVLSGRFGTVRRGSLGIPMKNVLTRLHPEDHSDDKKGLLLIQTPALFSHYLNPPDDPDLFINGFFNTLDFVRINEAGEYYLIERKKQIVKVAGESVDLNEIRTVINNIKGVTVESITTRPDRILHDKICCRLFIDTGITRDTIQRYLEENLASFKIPREMTFVLNG